MARQEKEVSMAGERILVVDDEKSMCQFLSIMLRKEGYDITTVSTGKKAIEEVNGSRFDVVLTDIKMAGMDGIEVLREIKRIDPTMPVVIMTAYASQKTAIEAVNQGAFHYLIKHAKNEEIKMVVRNALDMRKVRTENVMLKKQLKRTADLQHDHRQERGNAEGLRPGGQGGRHGVNHPHLRRERHRQGTDRARHPFSIDRAPMVPS